MAPATNMAITGTVNHDNTVNNKDIKCAVDMDVQDMVNNINNYAAVDKDIMALAITKAITVITLMSLVFMVTSLSIMSLMALLVVGTVITKDIKGDVDKDIQDMVNNITD